MPLGFEYAGVACGVRGDQGRLDVALFASDRPAVASGVFTTNKVCGAPVKVSRERLPRQTVRGVIINSGNANACTGERGLSDAKSMTQSLATQIGCDGDDVLVCSTGVIGRFLPLSKIEGAIASLWQQRAATLEGLDHASRAIMTTDTVPKIVSRRIHIDGKDVTITGVCKGAAMIAPNMATMLGVIMTDALVSSQAVQGMLKRAVDVSFNSISVEGHTSTSDSVIVLANGASGIDVSESRAFEVALTQVAQELSQKIIRDAEGAKHFVEVRIRGAIDHLQAQVIGKTIANDVLVKTAITGNDPNWGRIVSACGRTGYELSEAHMVLSINGLCIFDHGAPTDTDLSQVSAAMKTGEVVIELTLPFGHGEATIWTCDLTEEYVHLNADYTT